MFSPPSLFALWLQSRTDPSRPPQVSRPCCRNENIHLDRSALPACVGRLYFLLADSNAIQATACAVPVVPLPSELALGTLNHLGHWHGSATRPLIHTSLCLPPLDRAKNTESAVSRRCLPRLCCVWSTYGKENERGKIYLSTFTAEAKLLLKMWMNLGKCCFFFSFYFNFVWFFFAAHHKNEFACQF